MRLYIYYSLCIYNTKNKQVPYKIKIMYWYKWMKEIILKLKNTIFSELYTHFYFTAFK